jgi:hypothetical protein
MNIQNASLRKLQEIELIKNKTTDGPVSNISWAAIWIGLVYCCLFLFMSYYVS